MFIHVGTRRVLAAACTAEPNSAWVTQQARNLSWQLEDEGIKLSLVIRDHDRKFSGSFDRIFESARRAGGLDAADGATGQRPRRTMDRQLSAGMPGLDTDRLGGPPPEGPQGVPFALQR